MNMMKKNGGFTLVELIVVIAILAILAGVAVPAYSGYINNANEAADTTQLAAIKTAAMAACAKVGTVEKIVYTPGTTGQNATASKVEIYVDQKTNVTYTFTYSSSNWDAAEAAQKAVAADFNDYMNKKDITLKSFTSGAKWEGSEWSAK